MEKETESITQATNTLILKSPPENKNCCPHQAQDQNILKKPVTLAVIMLLIYGLKVQGHVRSGTKG